MAKYRIKDWDAHFETAETRKLENLRWVPTPNKHDGLGYRRIAAQRDRAELFAAWNLILQISSKGRRGERGKLARDDQWLNAADLSLMTGFPEQIFTRSLEFFTTELQWLIAEDCREISPTTADPASNPAESPARPADSPAPPASPPAERKKEGMEGKEQKEGRGAGGIEDVPENLRAETCLTALKKWDEHLTNEGKIMSRQVRLAFLLRCQREGEEKTVKAIALSIENGWKSIVWDHRELAGGGQPGAMGAAESPFAIQRRIDAAETQIQKIRNKSENYRWPAGGNGKVMNDEPKAEIKKLKETIDGLEKKMAGAN